MDVYAIVTYEVNRVIVQELPQLRDQVERCAATVPETIHDGLSKLRIHLAIYLIYGRL